MSEKRSLLWIVVLVVLCFLLQACDAGGGDECDGDADDSDGDAQVDGDDTDGDAIETDADLPVDGDSDTEAEEEIEDEEEHALPLLNLLEEGDKAIGGNNADARAGDYLFNNGVARFIIQGDGPARSWVPYGGTLIDADIVRSEGGPGEDLLGEMSVFTGMIRSFCPEAFEVMADGSDGGPAHLRVTGTDCGIPIVDMAIPTAPFGLTTTLDYVLEPDDRALRVTTTIVHHGSVRTIPLGDGMVWGNRLKVLTPGFGWGLEGLTQHGEFSYQLAMSPDVAYGLAPVEGALKVPIDQADILPFIGYSEKVFAERPVSYTRLFVVGKNAEEVRARILQEQGEERHTLLVDVELADEQDTDQVAEVIVLDEQDAPVSQAYLPAEQLSFSLAAGTYHIKTRQLGRPDGSSEVSITLPATDNKLSVTLPATGRVSYDIGGEHFDYTHKDGLPCRISVHNPANTGSILRRVYSATGTGVFLLEPGDYVLIASRGYEYEIVEESVSLAVSDMLEFSGDLIRSVDSSGWVVGDLHMHTERSVDAVVPVDERVVQLAAVGLELTPITDHDTISVLDPWVDELGLRDFLRILPGDEISPIWAHTNAYPVAHDHDHSKYYGVAIGKGYDEQGNYLDAKSNPEIWQDLRDNFNAGIIQVNHPRGSQGFFDAIDYDPQLGLDVLAAGVIDDNFDAIELLNACDINAALEEILLDWYSLLNQGWHKVGVSVSDSHSSDSPGDGRTWFRTGEDDPNQVSDDTAVAALQGQQAIAACGPFVTMQIGDAEIGETFTGAGPHQLSVRIQAPSWMPVDWLRVIVNGEQVHEEAIALTRGPMDISRTVTLPESNEDFWVVVLAGAPDKRLSPVSPGERVLSIANPIFVDVDGGAYQPPGLQSR